MTKRLLAWLLPIGPIRLTPNRVYWLPQAGPARAWAIISIDGPNRFHARLPVPIQTPKPYSEAEWRWE